MTAPTAHDVDYALIEWRLQGVQPDMGGNDAHSAFRRLQATISTLEATIARLTAPIADEALREAVERFERGCERRGVRCAEWYTFPDNICLGCVDDTFHRHQYVAGHEAGTGAATITTALNQHAEERRRLVTIEEAARNLRHVEQMEGRWNGKFITQADLDAALDKEATR